MVEVLLKQLQEDQVLVDQEVAEQENLILVLQLMEQLTLEVVVEVELVVLLVREVLV